MIYNIFAEIKIDESASFEAKSKSDALQIFKKYMLELYGSAANIVITNIEKDEREDLEAQHKGDLL